MLDVPARSTRTEAPRTASVRATSTGLWLASLFLVGLVSISLATGYLIAQRSAPTRTSSSQANTWALLSRIAATRDTQQIEIAQLQTELQIARQALATADAKERQSAGQNPAGQNSSGQAPAQGPPLALILDVPLFKQERSLSCESSAAAMAAKFYGLPIDESDVLRALPRHENPNVGFRGNVDGLYGGINDYGTYAEPIRQVLTGMGLSVTHLSGGIDEIKQHIREGHPVIAWVTYDMQVQTPRQVMLSNGTAVTLVPYEHTILIVGYNANGLWVHDPYDGTRTWYREDDFRRSFAYLGNMALVIGPRADSGPR